MVCDSGTLSISEIQGQDVSSGQTVNVSQNGEVVGTAQVVNGEIAFTLGSNLQNIDDGQSQNISFEYTVSDGQGGTDDANGSTFDKVKVKSYNDSEYEVTNLVATANTSDSYEYPINISASTNEDE